MKFIPVLLLVSIVIISGCVQTGPPADDKIDENSTNGVNQTESATKGIDENSESDVDIDENLETIRLNLTIDQWESEGNPETVHNVTNQLFEVTEGESFGPTRYNGAPAFEGVEPFTLLEIGEGSIKVGFHESIVVLGESIGDASKENPTTFSNEKCFRTRTYDSGTDFCINLEE